MNLSKYRLIPILNQNRNLTPSIRAGVLASLPSVPSLTLSLSLFHLLLPVTISEDLTLDLGLKEKA